MQQPPLASMRTTTSVGPGARGLVGSTAQTPTDRATAAVTAAT
jgi:hypothetical protein